MKEQKRTQVLRMSRKQARAIGVLAETPGVAGDAGVEIVETNLGSISGHATVAMDMDKRQFLVGNAGRVVEVTSGGFKEIPLELD